MEVLVEMEAAPVGMEAASVGWRRATASLPLQLQRRPLLLRSWLAAVGKAAWRRCGVSPVGDGWGSARWGWVGGGSEVGE
ncbi:hypothetical protein KY289_013601 [Solanum tuberosum]|nr:hypothetical protein KY289_013601 [Solanum tuberosum]